MHVVATTVVVSLLLMATKKKLLTKKRSLIVIIIAVLLVAAGVAGYYYFSRIEQTKQSASKQQTVDEKIDDIIAQSQKSDDASTQKQELKTLADNETDKSKKAKYLAAVVDLSINSGDTQGAKQAAESYDQLDESALSAAAVAKASEDVGDFANAAKYYGIAAERSPKPLSPEERAPYNDYMLQKAAMEAKL